MPFEITDLDDGQYEVTSSSKSNLVTLLPKFTGDNFINMEYSTGKLSGHILTDTNTLAIAVDVKINGELSGPYTGNLKDGLSIDFKDGNSQKLRIYLKNGNELWTNVDNKDSKGARLPL